MQPQIVHESEVHRQHVRLKIPIQVEIDGIRYQVDDWSIGGFGVESVMTSRQPGERFPVTLIFMFEDFDMTMRFDARMVYADQDHGRFGCAFLGLSAAADGALPLSGRCLSVGRGGERRRHPAGARARQHRARRACSRSTTPTARSELWAARLRRYGIDRGLRPRGPGAAGLVVLGIKDRYFTLEPEQCGGRGADRPDPRAGRRPLRRRAAARPARCRGDACSACINGLDGTVVSLESPCECVVLELLGAQRPALSGRRAAGGC